MGKKLSEVALLPRTKSHVILSEAAAAAAQSKDPHRVRRSFHLQTPHRKTVG